MTTETQKKIILYTAGTPNGYKAAITLEELAIPYEVKKIDITKLEQKEEWYLKINPNGRIPAIVDPNNNNFAVFESGALMLYLTDKYDKDHKLSYPHGSDLYWELVTWLFFQNAGVGPMQGQAFHFFRYAPEKIPYAINRYQNEVKRLYSVLENRLKKNGDWLVGDRMTIADIANFAWVNLAFFGGVEIKDFPVLEAWAERMKSREAVQRGLEIPKKYIMNPDNLDEKAQEISSWVLKGQENDSKKVYN
jgi:glutathione S-transferase